MLKSSEGLAALHTISSGGGGVEEKGCTVNIHDIQMMDIPVLAQVR